MYRQFHEKFEFSTFDSWDWHVLCDSVGMSVAVACLQEIHVVGLMGPLLTESTRVEIVDVG